jgi:hypothetical protein
MIIEGLQVPPFNTTLMGVVRGVTDLYGYSYSDAMLYGGTGHAFAMNIHEGLCPSGPYCWKSERFDALLRNLGVVRTDLGFFSSESSASERVAVEATIKEHLDRGQPCALANMENQLITGYDDTGFLTSQPWLPHADFPPGHLTWGSWAELGEEIHINFFTFERVPPAGAPDIVLESIECAVDMSRHPESYTDEPYGFGPLAYEKWIGAVEKGHGSEHGNWWNGTVWAECRARASDYLRKLGQLHPELGQSMTGLAESYAAIADHLAKASDKELDDAEKIRLLRESAAIERDCVEGLGNLTAELSGRLAAAAAST